MPELTTNLGLKKPLGNETADIAVINENMDTIDLELTKKATQTQDGRMSKEDKIKLDGIETGANKYVHPTTHPASIIDQDETHRFVTDTEKADWNSRETPTGAQAKANTAETNAKTYAEGLFDDLAGEGRTTETIKANADNIALHENNKNNPHNVTIAQIGAAASSHGHSNATTNTAGFMSAADKSKLNGIEAGAQVNPTASEILTSIKTVDGSGSGLDADTVDGHHITVSTTAPTNPQVNDIWIDTSGN